MVTKPKSPNGDKEITKPKINLSSFKPFDRPPQATHLLQLARVRLGNMTRQPDGIAGIIANMTSSAGGGGAQTVADPAGATVTGAMI
jgi:hypothetical protein